MKFILLPSLLASLASSHPHQGSGPCPFSANPAAPFRALAERSGDGGVPEGGYAAVMADLKVLLTDSQDFWPADFEPPIGPNYGGLFIRLAWHCSGSYRQTDGRGGCDGGRIRHDPEINWPDNGNLDMALKLLEPIKAKYGSDLSWGDLIVLSGTVAIKEMGGPYLGFCGGRIDDADGSDSLTLGPSAEQQAIGPCSEEQQGKCLDVEGSALGPTTVGLIYVNPEGPKGEEGDTVASGRDIHRAFGNMGFNDSETVSLIGGGHAFGKMHGACADPPCGPEGPLQGKGPNTVTAGFEGTWTTRPTTWSNDYFTSLFSLEWNKTTSPTGALQWEPISGEPVVMLTTDLAMRDDPDYLKITEMYRDDITVLERDFEASWYRLTTQDMGPRARCLGDDIPPQQPWQFDLPAAPETMPDYTMAKKSLQEMVKDDEATADMLIELAYDCASTFRQTDHRGGCNGARIMFSPEIDWESNAGAADGIAKLKSIKPDDVSMADMIVLGGIVALGMEDEIPFCGGYVDAADGDGSVGLEPRTYSTPFITVNDDWQVKGLTMEQATALASRKNVSTEWFKNLVATKSATTTRAGTTFTPEELALVEDDFFGAADKFATDEAALMEAFKSGWMKLMTADRFKNNRENACDGVDVFGVKAPAAETPSSESMSSPASESMDSPDSGVSRPVVFAGLLMVLGWFM